MKRFASTVTSAKPQKKGGIFGKLLGVVLVGGTTAAGGLYYYDKPTFDSYLQHTKKFISTQYEQLSKLPHEQKEVVKVPVKHVVKKEETVVAPVVVTPSPSPPSPTVVTESPTTSKKSSLDKERIQLAVKSELADLENRMNLLAMTYQSNLRLAQLAGYKELDILANAFQQELEKTRAENDQLKNEYEKAIEQIKNDFDRLVEAKVDQQTRFRLAELQSLGVTVDKLRQHTLEFGEFASLHAHTLRLLKLVDTLPYTETARKDIAVKKDPFVKTVLDSMPTVPESIEHLHASYSLLKPRLHQIALVPKDGGLFSYLLSRLLTPFMFRADSKIDKIETQIKRGNLIDALQGLVELEGDGWNSLILDDFVDRLRKRVEFELGLSALDAHLGLISSCSISPSLSQAAQ